MTEPRAEVRYNRNGQRVYVVDGHEVPSVSTLKGLRHSFGLEAFKISQAVDQAYQHADLVERLDQPTFRKLVREAAKQDRTAIDIGNRVHEVAEAFVLGQPLPDYPETEYAVRAVREFGQEVDMEVAYAERSFVYWPTDSPVPLFAGTADLGAWIDTGTGHQRLAVIDYKSGKRVQPDHYLSTGAYALATHRLDERGDLVRLEAHEIADMGVVLHVRPRGWAAHIITGDDLAEIEVAVSALSSLWQYANGPEKDMPARAWIKNGVRA